MHKLRYVGHAKQTDNLCHNRYDITNKQTILLLLRDVIPPMSFIGSLQISKLSSNILFKFNDGL